MSFFNKLEDAGCISSSGQAARKAAQCVRRKRARARAGVCVCVCVTLCFQEFFNTQGVAAGTRVCHQRRHSRFPGDTGTDHPSVPAVIASCSNPPFLIHGSCMFPPINRFSHRTFQQLVHCISGAREKHVLNNTSHRTLSPCCSLTFLPIVAIESN